MGIWLIIIAVIVVVIALMLFMQQRVVRGAGKNVIVTAVIDIYASGNHHIELIPANEVHPVDLVQLAISYIANIFLLSVQGSFKINQLLDELIQFSIRHGDISDEHLFRQELNNLVKRPRDSLLPSGKLAIGTSERYRVRLIRGKQFDYSLSEFSMLGYKPNLENSSALLYAEIASMLGDSYLLLLHKSLIGLIDAFQREKPTTNNNQVGAFVVVSHTLSVLPGSIENSHDRILRGGPNSRAHGRNVTQPHALDAEITDALDEFEYHVIQVVNCLAEADEGWPTLSFETWAQKLFEEKYLINTQLFDKAEFEAKAAQNAIENVQQIWPQGKRILREFSSGTKNLLNKVQTHRELHLLTPPDANFTDEITFQRYIHQARQYTAKSEKHFINGRKRLEKKTGYVILDGFTLYRS